MALTFYRVSLFISATVNLGLKACIVQEFLRYLHTSCACGNWYLFFIVAIVLIISNVHLLKVSFY